MKIVAIVQARMGSTRLPGKVLMDISGKPMLWHVINRLKHAKLLDEVIVATTTNKEDDIIEKICRDFEWSFYRGSSEDVLGRYFMAAKEQNADSIVRITSDCPLIDPEIVDLVIKSHINSGADYTSNTIKRTFPRGLDTEVFSFSALKKAHSEAKDYAEREHVSAYLYQHPDLFKLHNVENNINLAHLRWTVDEERDLMLVREIYKRLYHKARIFLLEDIIKALQIEPHIAEINKDIKQKNVR